MPLPGFLPHLRRERCRSNFSFLAAEINVLSLIPSCHWSHFARLRIWLDHQVPRGIIAEVLGLAVRMGQDEELFLCVVLERGGTAGRTTAS
jgi:hypothetical protein